MFKPKINYRWPATLSGFSKETNENFSRAKLNVFYKGETADHRYFSDSFAQEIISSLPYTPVVTHYDEEKQDFVGHASEQQLYGIVDPCVAPRFEVLEDGNEWCICDVVLYTERPDTAGEIAKKIVGHSQSLELDPRTVKYVVNYDEKKHFKNIEFTAGTFVGISVLGDNQDPAFTGSSFFENNEQFNKKMEILRNYCEGKINSERGTSKMELKDFLKLSWGEIATKVIEVIEKEYGEEYCISPIDFTETWCVCRFYSYIDGSMKLYRLTYVIDEQVNAVLQGINEVHITYEDLESPSDEATGVNSQLEVNPENITTEDNTAENTETTESTETMSTEENLTDVSEDVTTDTSATDLNENEVEPVLNGIDDSTIDVSANVVADSSIVMNSDTTDVNPTDAEFASDTEKGTVNEGQEQTTAQATGTASFTDSERAELEALKKEKKLTLISNYEDFLTEEDKDALINSIDDYDENALEFVLLKKYKEYKDLEHNSFNKMAPLAAPEPHKPEAADKQLNSYIRRMLRR